MNRRTFVAALPVALAACTTTAPTVQTGITDLELLVGSASPPSGLVGAYEAFKVAYPGRVSAAVDAKIEGIIAQAETDMAVIASAAPAIVPITTAQTVMGYIQQVMTLAAPFIQAVGATEPAVLTAWQAAEVMIPVVEAEIAAMTPLSTPPVAVKARKYTAHFRSGMTVTAARKVLS